MESEGLLLEQGLDGSLGLGLVVGVDGVLALGLDGGLALGLDGVLALGLDGALALALALELAFLCLQIEDIEKPSEEGLV